MSFFVTKEKKKSAEVCFSMLVYTCLSDSVAPVPNRSVLYRAAPTVVIGARPQRNSAAAAGRNTSTTPSRPDYVQIGILIYSVKLRATVIRYFASWGIPLRISSRFQFFKNCSRTHWDSSNILSSPEFDNNRYSMNHYSQKLFFIIFSLHFNSV